MVVAHMVEGVLKELYCDPRSILRCEEYSMKIGTLYMISEMNILIKAGGDRATTLALQIY